MDGRRLLGARQLTISAVVFRVCMAVVLVAGCGGGSSADAVPRLTFVEAYGIAYYLPEASEGHGISLGVVNHTDRALEITAVHVDADPELDVEYVGWATCRRGCFGAAHWKSIVADQAKGQMVFDGKLPVPLEPNGKARGGFGPVSLEFRVVLDEKYHHDPAPCYRVSRITVDLASGEEAVPIVYDDRYPLVLQARETDLDDECFSPATPKPGKAAGGG
ncbi:MAG: hypothetical protein ACRDV9_01650 [Acidimicrobiia bacterium]